MARGTGRANAGDGPGRKRAINWVAGLSAVATLLTGCAAMITAANGVWHPPVPIPVLKANITWVGPTPATTPPSATAEPATPATAVAPMPSPTPSALTLGVPTPPAGPSTVADLGNQVTMWISSLIPGSTISLTIANHGVDPFVLNFDAADVTVYDDLTPPHVYSVRSNGGTPSIAGNHQVIQASVYACNGCARFEVDGVPASTARHWTVALKAISGRQNVSMTYTLA